jgi:hypothetical protein
MRPRSHATRAAAPFTRSARQMTIAATSMAVSVADVCGPSGSAHGLQNEPRRANRPPRPPRPAPRNSPQARSAQRVMPAARPPGLEPAVASSAFLGPDHHMYILCRADDGAESERRS